MLLKLLVLAQASELMRDPVGSQRASPPHYGGVDSTSAGEPDAPQGNARITLLRHLRTEAHLQIGHVLLAGRVTSWHSPVKVVCFMTTEPEAGLTFHARLVKGRAQAGMVTVTRDTLDVKGIEAAREGLAYLLHLAAMHSLPRVQPFDRTPLVGLWSTEDVWRGVREICSSDR